MTVNGTKLNVKLEDKTSGALFANCPVEAYPGLAIEPVSDSSRYFVLKIQDDNGRTAFIGVGFGDRSDSFDMNVALQDHFKWVKNQEQIEKEKVDPKPQLDLGFKEGETIKINMKITVIFIIYLIFGRSLLNIQFKFQKKDGTEGTARAKPKIGGLGILPPPPSGAGKIAPPPQVSPNSAQQNTTEWGEFASSR